MKKLLALLTALCLLTAAAAAFAETPAPEAFTLPNGITFGMTRDQVIAAEAGKFFEQDRSRTFAVVFEELEYDHVTFNGVPADVQYLFVDDALVAVKVQVDTRNVPYAKLMEDLKAQYEGAVPADLAQLGNGVFAVDDEGRPEFNTAAFLLDNVMIVVELDEEDIDVTFVDLSAGYIR